MSTENPRSFHWPMLVTLLLIPVMAAFSGALINPTIPAIQNTFSHLPNSETLAQLVSTMSAPIVVIVAPIVGYLLDRYQRKPVLIMAILIYGIGTSIAFFLDSLYLILATRVFDGIAIASIMVTVPTLISDYYSGSRREVVMGWYGAIQAGGGAVAALFGGVIADIHWRYIFLIYALALLLVPPVIRYLPEPSVTRNDEEISRTEAAVKIVRESPVLLLVSIYALMTFTMLTMNLIQIEVPYYLQESVGVSGSMTGITLSGFMVLWAVSSAMYGRMKRRLRYTTILVIAFSIATVGYTIISATSNFLVVFFGILTAAGGIGLVVPTVNDWVAAIVKEEYRGRALSGVTTMMYLGFAVSPFAPTPLVNRFGRQGMLLVWAGFLLVITVVMGTLWWFSRGSTTVATPAADHTE
ncbi:MFS transporter [Halocatena pleomorpha]|uniref:MFS transporter n=1 Tax=Halocatena pleomorpha TaxID=1785090 RepID=A0A3P3RDI8_9EURY|nr:MFS transporter [Halocatena pleomorpha]RRJ31465.1 MFS transporter [Halocatena pleomorpha]